MEFDDLKVPGSRLFHAIWLFIKYTKYYQLYTVSKLEVVQSWQVEVARYQEVAEQANAVALTNKAKKRLKYELVAQDLQTKRQTYPDEPDTLKYYTVGSWHAWH